MRSVVPLSLNKRRCEVHSPELCCHLESRKEYSSRPLLQSPDSLKLVLVKSVVDFASLYGLQLLWPRNVLLGSCLVTVADLHWCWWGTMGCKRTDSSMVNGQSSHLCPMRTAHFTLLLFLFLSVLHCQRKVIGYWMWFPGEVLKLLIMAELLLCIWGILWSTITDQVRNSMSWKMMFRLCYYGRG